MLGDGQAQQHEALARNKLWAKLTTDIDALFHADVSFYIHYTTCTVCILQL